MKILILGPKAEGKTRLLEVLRRRVLEDYGSEVRISDGGIDDFIQGGMPQINIYVTNDAQAAAKFLQED